MYTRVHAMCKFKWFGHSTLPSIPPSLSGVSSEREVDSAYSHDGSWFPWLPNVKDTVCVSRKIAHVGITETPCYLNVAHSQGIYPEEF